MKNRAMAKRKGYCVTMSAIPFLKNSMLPLKNVSPIQAIPKMLTMAFIPAPKMLPFTASPTLALPTMRMRAAIDIIRISMVCGMDRRCISPSTMYEGRKDGMLPKRTTRNTPSRNAHTARLAYLCWVLDVGGWVLVDSRVSLGSMRPSFTRRWYSGSSTSSLPTRFCTNDETRMAMSEAGIQTSRMSFSSMPFPPSRSVLMTAAVAADIGLPVIPKEAAIVATVMGRSGRILLLVAISEIMGSSE